MGGSTVSSASLTGLSLTEASGRLEAGEVSSEDLVCACLDHIALRDGQIVAFDFINPSRRSIRRVSATTKNAEACFMACQSRSRISSTR